MSRWYRVFGANDAPVEPARLLEEARRLEPDVTARFRGDDLGWFHADLVVPDEEEPVPVERYLSSEEDIRRLLNTWAAWLEETGPTPEAARLMQHVIGTAQVITLGPLDPDADPALDRFCTGLCRFLARATAGVYHVDGGGFFAPDGTLLVPEP
jgi:hypothetical protein